MMRRYDAPLLLAAALLLGGCSSGGGPGADELLAGAHRSLDRGDTKNARTWLESARPVVESQRQKKEYRLLEAELDVRTGRAARALGIADKLLAAYPEDPRVHELAGKARMTSGDFTGASVEFTIARAAYRDEADVARAADLIALSSGLEAYAAGRLAVAQDQWDAIRSPQLRASVFDESGEDKPAHEAAGKPVAWLD